MPRNMAMLWNQWKSALLTGGFLALILLLFWNANAFSQLQLALSNAYFITTSTSDSIIIVSIDDRSLAEYGRTPAEWSRSLYGDLAEIVSDNGARVLAYDLIFSESTPDDETFADSLALARQSDARTRIILSGAGVQLAPNFTVDNFPNGLRYTTSLQPNSTLSANADYIAYVNAFPDVDGRLRRQPSMIQVDGEVQYSLSLAVFFAQRRIPSNAIEQIISADEQSIYLTDDLTLSVDERGLWLQNYFGAPYVPDSVGAFSVISFRDVLDGTVDPTIFNDKIVLVGLIDSLGATDQYLVPSSTSGALMSGVEIQANAIETLLSNVPLTAQSPVSQALMIIGLTLISSLVFNQPRWYWKLLLWFIMILGFLVTAFFIFTSQRLMLNLFYGIQAITLPAILTIGLEISREITRRRRTEFLLQSVVSIAEQNMVIDNVLPLIAEDVQGVVPDSGGFIWVYSSDNQTTPKEYPWRLPVADDTLSDLAQRAVKNSATQITSNQLAVPIIWRGDILGLIATQSNRPISQAHISLIEDLAQRLAPTFENITLHRSIDQQNRLLEMVLKSSPASIIVVDYALKILRSNHRFSQWVSMDSDAIPNADLMTLFRRREIDEAVITDLQSKIDAGTGFEIQLRDNQNHALRLSAVPMSELGHWVMVLVDITDLVQLNELKTQMIRMASHDLKNPLSRVLGYSEIILTSEVLDATNERFMTNIMNAADEINQIITDILDLEQLRSGHVDRKPGSFKNLVREIVLRHEPDKDRKKQSLTLDMPDHPITVDADLMRLGQAVSNLISNAIKYTPDEGQINVRIWQPDPTKVQLEVKDNGYGIAEEAQAKLFTEFYRVKSKETRGISGTGLGLSLVKTVVESHDGRIWVKSAEGEGSTFYMVLPISGSETENI